MERAERRNRDGTDERVGWSADTAGEDDRTVGPAVAMEDVRDLDRVRHDRQVEDVQKVVHETPVRRAGGERDRLARLDEGARLSRDRVLLLELAVRLRLEAGLLGAGQPARGRTAVHLVEHAGVREHLEVAPDCHVRHRQELGQLADAHGAAPAHLVGDQLTALLGEQRGALSWFLSRCHSRHDRTRCAAIRPRLPGGRG